MTKPEDEEDSKPSAKEAPAEPTNPSDAPTETDEDGGEGPSENDLVIRDGFPALRIPGTKWKPMISGDEPIPRHGFWSMDEALQFDPLHLPTLLQDCETVFTAQDKPAGSAYSAGETFFLPATMQPRCALEALAKSIFQKHVAHLEPGTFNPAQSGANWWTLVLDDDEGNPSNGDDEQEEDEVGLHFDADYELEEQTTNLLLHPRVATITYLSDYGAPTLILEQKSPPMEDLKKTTLEKGIKKAWLSHPAVGKHTVFDGRFLHGAPALYFPSLKETKRAPDGEESAPKRVKVSKKRYTLLVNIWLNHWVMDAGVLDEEICKKLKTPFEMPDSNLKSDDSDDKIPQPFQWKEKVDLSKVPDQGMMEKVKLAPSNVDPAGEDELALCNHNVTIKYNPLMSECHKASAAGRTVELELAEGTITLHVGDELEEASDDEQ